MLPNMYAWVNIASGVLLGIYIWLLFNGPGLNKENGLITQVTGQQIIAYAAMICMFVTAYGSRDVVIIHCKETDKRSWWNTNSQVARARGSIPPASILPVLFRSRSLPPRH